MSLYEWCASGFGIAFAIMSLVQISPIKIDPWTWLGNAFFKGVPNQSGFPNDINWPEMPD